MRAQLSNSPEWSSTRWVGHRLWLLGLWLIALTTLGAPGVNPLEKERIQGRLICLAGIATYTEWPATAFADDKSPIVLGILGDDPFGKQISMLNDYPVKGRKWEVKHFKDATQVKGCHILYISAPDKEEVSKMARALDAESILTITEEMDRFEDSGAVLNLVEKEKRGNKTPLRWEINLEAARKARLKMSPGFVNLAVKKIKA